jgi:hypothetical protein
MTVSVLDKIQRFQFFVVGSGSEIVVDSDVNFQIPRGVQCFPKSFQDLAVLESPRVRRVVAQQEMLLV